jgi:alkane 1-monooxygenase
MRIRSLKFAAPLSIFVLSYLAFTKDGWWIAAPLLYAWVFIPLLELLLPSNASNLSEQEAALAKDDRLYDFWLYIIVPIQYAGIFLFIHSIEQSKTGLEIAGRIFVMGLLCGSFGINVAHELGHRKNKFERLLAKSLLLTSLYMHFYIEHNKGHHKNVSTPEDPSSARKGETVYAFYLRSVFTGFQSAWKIAADDQKKKKKPVWHLSNEMIQFLILQVVFIIAIYLYTGFFVTSCFVAAAILGFLLLETVNYIEHYGLQRKQTETGYERAMPVHSWNSDHVIGRLMLFELSRHSDHHYMASKKYQLLKHHEDAPQMPTGYPGMMILSLIPPIWFGIMHRKLAAIQQ